MLGLFLHGKHFYQLLSLNFVFKLRVRVGRWVAGWVAGWVANSASIEVEVEVEAELGKN